MSDTTGKLANLAAMIRDAELARLKQLQEARRLVEGHMKALHTERQAVFAMAAPDAAHVTGSDGRWLAWATQQGTTLSVQNAQAAAAAEVQMVRARRAFGRAAVLERLSKKV